MEYKKDIVVVGSIAFDSIKTIKGTRNQLIGGSGTYFSLAASLYADVHLVGVVGNDFSNQHISMFHKKNISTKHLIKEDGDTFKWGGVYSDDFSTRETLFTELGVFENFNPIIDSSQFNKPILFLANIQPSLQIKVINQINDPSLIVLDTMNLWIDNNYDELIEAIKMSDILLINDEEIIQLTDNNNIDEAAQILLKLGLDAIIIKKGSKGALIVSGNTTTSIPVVPNIDVFDPTGAGDSFAGGFLGHIASNNKLNLIDAVITGTALASYTVSAFGIEGIKKLELHNIEKRIKLIKDIMGNF